MVDFAMMGKLAHQRDTIVALFAARLHRRILIVVRDSNDVERVHHDLFGAISRKDCRVYRPNRSSYRIESLDKVCWIEIITSYQLPSTQGQEYDLVWFRYLDGREPVEAIARICMACRAGYGPLMFWGNVPEDTVTDVFNR